MCYKIKTLGVIFLQAQFAYEQIIILPGGETMSNYCPIYVLITNLLHYSIVPIDTVLKNYSNVNETHK